ncbi:MAG: ATP binding protein [Watsoniomyces obsoletus]|nr:MAG: ATP binding protein [Watsoniomyces obsoletus]
MPRYTLSMLVLWALLFVATPIWGQEQSTSTRSSSVPTPTIGGRDHDGPPTAVTGTAGGLDDGPPPWVRDKLANGGDPGPPPWVRDGGPPPWVKDEKNSQQGQGDRKDGPPPWVQKEQQREGQGPPPPASTSTTKSNSLTTTPTPAPSTSNSETTLRGTTIPPTSRAQSNSAPRNVIIIIVVLISTVIFTGIVMVTIVLMDRKLQRRNRAEMAAGRLSKMPTGMMKALWWRNPRPVSLEPTWPLMREHRNWNDGAMMTVPKPVEKEDREQAWDDLEKGSSRQKKSDVKDAPPYPGLAHPSLPPPSFHTALNSHRFRPSWFASFSRPSTVVVPADPLDPTNPFGAGATKTVDVRNGKEVRV